MTRSDVLILGSGFGGSLLAAILARGGLRVILIDRRTHPRFAIGESTTPLADATLRRIADEFGVPELLPLCSWGAWKRFHPELMCGRKRGFTYFHQAPGCDLAAETFEPRRLLVSASVDNEHSDTHWLRSDVDQFLFRLAFESGVECYQGVDVRLTRDSCGWQADETAGANPICVSSRFVIDATGSATGVLKSLNIADSTPELRTNSRSVFAHFRTARTCEELLHERRIATGDFPFRCDDAAVHHVLDEGWMWQLRFDDDTLSAGFVIDQRGQPPHDLPNAETQWHRHVNRYPFLSEQFRNATVVRPGRELLSSPRLQRLAKKGAGSDWAALPNTIGFIDPLHSTGIAHTLIGVTRLARILLHSLDPSLRSARLDEYSRMIIREIRFVDELVEGCYAALPSFRLWCAWSMLYFAAVTSLEQDSAGDSEFSSGFLHAGNAAFRSVVAEARSRLQEIPDRTDESQQAAFIAFLRTVIAPWNRVGLFDDSVRGLYSSTAAPVPSVAAAKHRL